MIEIKKKDATTWEYMDNYGDVVLGLDFEVTDAGIELNGQLIPWLEIDAARKAVTE